MSGPVNHHGRVTGVDEKIEAIKASDLMLLMKVVEMATGLYNAIERGHELDVHVEWEKLGESLRELGLIEVTDADAG